jgi:hypothetical protein
MLVVGFALRKVEWKLKKMPREVPRPRKAKGVYVLLFPVIGYAYSDRHGLRRTPKLDGYCHRTLVTTDWTEGAKDMCLAIVLPARSEGTARQECEHQDFVPFGLK